MDNFYCRLLIIICLILSPLVNAREIALTFDDAPTPDSSLMTGIERTEKIIAALKKSGVDDALFYVKADYINPQYKAIAQQTLNRSPRHVLLLHENDAAALFVGDLVKHLQEKGWKIISPQQAYADPMAENFPQVAFQKQGRLAAIAASKGIAESALRHPSENEAYLQKAFNDAGIAVDKNITSKK